MASIVDHNEPTYRMRWRSSGINRHNGAFYYSKELVQSIIPKIKTDRSWVTVNTYGKGVADHSIVFVHNNLHPENYKWLKQFKDMILVCGIKDTMAKVKEFGFPIYLPLSVNVGYVKRFEREKTENYTFAGRKSKYRKAMARGRLPRDCGAIAGVPRTKMLELMAKYREIYAVGRTAIEAKVLGCKILPYDERFPDPKIWKVLDHSEAVRILQRELDKAERKIRKGAKCASKSG